MLAAEVASARWIVVIALSFILAAALSLRVWL